MGRHQRPDRRSTSPRSNIPRRLGVIATLVAGFVAAQVLLPASSAPLSDQPTRIPAAAAALTETVAGAAAPRSSATQSDKRTAALSDTADTDTADTAPAEDADADLPRHSGSGRRVVYSISMQRVWTVGSAGQVQRTYLVSGRLSQPGAGHYRVYSKSRWTSSTVSAETMQYMVRFTHGARTGTPIGFHSIPRDYNGHAAQSVGDLGKPLSAGCIRQRLRDAVWLWDFAHVGTKVVVTR